MKLQITITEEEEKLLAQRASLLGYDVTKYAKFLLTTEARKSHFLLNRKLEKIIERALRDDSEGKTHEWVFGKYENQSH